VWILLGEIPNRIRRAPMAVTIVAPDETAGAYAIHRVRGRVALLRSTVGERESRKDAGRDVIARV